MVYHGIASTRLKDKSILATPKLGLTAIAWGYL